MIAHSATRKRGYAMKHAIAILFTIAVAVGTTSPAEARGGCGIGFHRGPLGACRANGAEAVVAAPNAEVVVGDRGPAVGVFVTGRGYWDGRRYWWHRERWRGGWRYR